MQTKTKVEELVGNLEDLATVAPPAKVELPKLSPKRRKVQEKPLSVLSKLASGISKVRVSQPAPKKQPAPKVHRRPRELFD